MAIIDAVIFDIDGTLIDSVDAHALSWQRAFAHFGHDIAYGAMRAQIGKGGDLILPVFLTRQEIDRFGKALQDFRSVIFKRDYLPGLRAFPGVRALFERLTQDGRRLALASSAKGDELDTYIAKAQIGDLLAAAISGDDVARAKPYPDVFAAALARLDCPARAALAIGDSPYDAEAAGKIGLATIGVRCGGFPDRALRDAGCIAIYDDPADLLRRYDDWAHAPKLGIASAAAKGAS